MALEAVRTGCAWSSSGLDGPTGASRAGHGISEREKSHEKQSEGADDAWRRGSLS
jgi:hypothetical protein